MVKSNNTTSRSNATNGFEQHFISAHCIYKDTQKDFPYNDAFGETGGQGGVSGGLWNVL